MAHKYAFEAVYLTLRDIVGSHNKGASELPFGGKTILMGGDFRQILPVVHKGKRQDIVMATINRSYLWDHCRVYTLTKSMRIQEEIGNEQENQIARDFNKWLLKMGNGTLPAQAISNEDDPTWIEIPSKHYVEQHSDNISRIIATTFPNFEANWNNETYLKERAILTPLNTTAEEINQQMYKLLPTQQKTYKSCDEICQASQDSNENLSGYPTEFLNTLTFPGMPSHLLTLKCGTPVLLLRNINPSLGLCNGTRLIITHLGTHIVRGKILTGSNIGSMVDIPRIIISSNDGKLPFVLKRRQYPLRLCYAMTINKSQGQSLSNVGIYLPNPVFTHGQLYVAASRVTNPKGLKILINEKEGHFKQHTCNIVYKEVFNNIPHKADRADT